MTMRVVHLAIYPEKGAPGVDLSTVAVEQEGLAGDRRKKAAIHLVTMPDMDQDDPPRANIVVDTAGTDLESLVGQQLQLGTVTLGVTQRPSNCPGIYADVIRPGQVSVGDDIDVTAPDQTD
ncbi:hypothetical protein [Luteipulveratus mongoliensis]|uniref:MOSC domain-containing protein n=1 Tax=Luteipulveratus mongoliensis TaxID=571913 RepID=A0A0K1JJW3_9MICO|nr:hypothetical protein [Luteipulveratus mongoliensis]AKU16873.1 hypothetical protein VV02_15025 [Luteipulveratus mongoliensis]